MFRVSKNAIALSVTYSRLTTVSIVNFEQVMLALNIIADKFRQELN